jgi:hypothetical protein
LIPLLEPDANTRAPEYEYPTNAFPLVGS